MKENQSINIDKTEKAGTDAFMYGDDCELGLTHYLGNDENKPREVKSESSEDKRKIGHVAFGNVDEKS